MKKLALFTFASLSTLTMVPETRAEGTDNPAHAAFVSCSIVDQINITSGSGITLMQGFVPIGIGEDPTKFTFKFVDNPAQPGVEYDFTKEYTEEILKQKLLFPQNEFFVFETSKVTADQLVGFKLEIKYENQEDLCGAVVKGLV